jgi:hypothetical protein
MRHIKPRESFLQYLEGKKLIEIIEDEQPEPVAPHQDLSKYQQLVELVRTYRHQQKAYFAKLKRKEFAKDEQHFMMKTQEKIDLLLKHITI